MQRCQCCKEAKNVLLLCVYKSRKNLNFIFFEKKRLCSEGTLIERQNLLFFVALKKSSSQYVHITFIWTFAKNGLKSWRNTFNFTACLQVVYFSVLLAILANLQKCAQLGEDRKTAKLIQAASTLRRSNLKTQPIVYTSPSRKRSFSKTLCKPDGFGNAVFSFSCGRKTF